MRQYYKIAAAGFCGLMLTACADTTLDYIQVEKPQSIAEYEYLNAYSPLKEYIDRAAHPGFLLGGAIAASDYINKGVVYRLANSNYDQITAGNAMKYASVVNDNGDMDFSTVEAFVEAAKGAGMQIYGHTLCWHAQQNVKWLNSLIADRELDVDPNEKILIEDAKKDFSNDAKFPFYVMSYEPQIVGGILTVPEYPGEWYQFFVMNQIPTVPGRSYTITAKIRGSKPGDLNVQFGNWGATMEKKMSFTDEWDECSVDIDGVTTESSFVVFQPGTYDGKLEIEWIKLSHSEAPAMEVETEVNKQTYTDGPFPFHAMGCEPPVIDGCIHFVPTGDWSQFFIFPGGDNPLTEGDYVVYLDMTASEDASGVQLTMQNGWGGDAQNVMATVPVVAGQNTYKLKFSGITGGNYDMILKPQTAMATLDVRSVTVCRVEKMNKLPLSPEEKAEVLDAELSRWIKGMMDATGGYVTAWDVVNEALQDTWGDIPLKNGVDNADPNSFYWQDYLGENYVRNVVKYAREHYAAQEGANPSDLKLFINDYNLEAANNNNDKCKSLVNWIAKWEADGITKIDGIGSQMHVTYSLNPETQKRNEEAVVNMLNILKDSGKLIRITELDMGISDADNQTIKTEDVTFEQHKLMADYYKFIIQKYFEIIPLSQQYGICNWAITDSPAESGWRGGEPIGLWNLNYQRKPEYGGFADGLSGK